MNNVVVVILAAGRGTRMNSDIPKVCHTVGNKPMIEHITNTAKSINPNDIIIVVSQDNIKQIQLAVNNPGTRFKIQYRQLGTAHAVTSAFPCCDQTRNLLVLLGDVPLIKPQTLKKIVDTKCDAVIIGFKDNNPDNRFGRIIVKNNRVNRIVEYLDATPDERKVTLCNSGLLWIKADHVPLLNTIDNKNKKGEYYLTDIIKIMVEKGLNIGFLKATKEECMGVNTREDLKKVNKIYNSQNG